MENIQFKNDPNDLLFFRTLRRKVNQYFNDNDLPKTATYTARLKATLLLSLYLLVSVTVFYTTSAISFFLLYGALGALSIFLALNLAHDAAHNTFSANKKINDWLLYTFDFLGANGYLWRLKHVHSHHPHVNIPDMDGDIKQSKLVRIFPNAPFLNFHRYQFLYMPVLYLFYTLHWLCFRDFKDFFEGEISGKRHLSHTTKEYFKLFLGKAFFLSRLILLPVLLTTFSFSTVLLAFLIYHLCASGTVALALISAHVGEHSVYPAPNEHGKMPTSWVRHQIVTTSDFATDSWWLTHLFGGFNHHVVHHLFPNICHIHYPQLTKILRTTCDEFGMPYYATPSLFYAMRSHFRFLKLRSKEGKQVEYIEM